MLLINARDLRYAARDAWQNTAFDPEIIKSVCQAYDTEHRAFS